MPIQLSTLYLNKRFNKQRKVWQIKEGLHSGSSTDHLTDSTNCGFPVSFQSIHLDCWEDFSFQTIGCTTMQQTTGPLLAQRYLQTLSMVNCFYCIPAFPKQKRQWGTPSLLILHLHPHARRKQQDYGLEPLRTDSCLLLGCGQREEG